MIQRKHIASTPEMLVSYLNELQIMRIEPFRMISGETRVRVGKSGVQRTDETLGRENDPETCF